MKKLFGGIIAGILSFSVFFAAPVTARADTNLNDFPESYRPYIQQMLTEHPLWSFEAYNTGVSWNDFLRYELTPGVNLIENNVPDFWLSKAQGVTYNGNKINLYDFTTGKYYIFSAPNWVQPVDYVIAYYMDPRNFLNSSDVFMFEHMIYHPGYHTVESVEAVLQNTWMCNAKLEDNPFMSYAQAFVNIGKELGISPFLLATRVAQEQGRGDSPLISGNYPGYEGYYNYFNIGASGQTSQEIYKNGMEEAKRENWNNRYASLLGGAKKIYDRYMERQQTTLYFQKFDVAMGAVSWHQYMQNVRAPLSEGMRVREGYQSYGIMDSAFVFRIPVFGDMPASACEIKRPEVIGDVNFDGRIDSNDALAVLRNVVGLLAFDDVQARLADVDGNGELNSVDSLYILKYAVRVIDRFPVEG